MEGIEGPRVLLPFTDYGPLVQDQPRAFFYLCIDYNYLLIINSLLLNLNNKIFNVYLIPYKIVNEIKTNHIPH